jgi:hypothetical protein
MFSRITSKIVPWLLNALELQLFLMVTSLPILVCWGLPVSLLGLFGNILFTPFLCLFLGLSACICVLGIFQVKIMYLATLLNYLTDIWYGIMQYADKWVLIYMPQPSCILLLLPIIALVLLYFHPRSYRSQIIRIIGIAMILILTQLVWRIAHIPYRYTLGKNQCVIDKNSEGLIIEYCSKAPRNNEQWIRYTLIPACAKNFGTLYCSVFEIKRLTPTMIDFTQGIIKEFSPRRVQYCWCSDEGLKRSWNCMLEQNGYKKRKGNCYALPEVND